MSHRHPHNILNTLQQLMNYNQHDHYLSSMLLYNLCNTQHQLKHQPIKLSLHNLTKSTEPYQSTLSTSTKTENQRTPMPKRYCHSAQKSQLDNSMSPATRSKRMRHSSTDYEHYIISPVFEPRLNNRKVLTSPVNDIDPYADAVPHLDNDFSDWT